MPTNLAWKHTTDFMTAVPPANGSPERDDEARLIERARSGDVDAFEHVYRREVGRVYALCLRMTADAARARAELKWAPSHSDPDRIIQSAWLWMTAHRKSAINL